MKNKGRMEILPFCCVLQYPRTNWNKRRYIPVTVFESNSCNSYVDNFTNSFWNRREMNVFKEPTKENPAVRWSRNDWLTLDCCGEREREREKTKLMAAAGGTFWLAHQLGNPLIKGSARGVLSASVTASYIYIRFFFHLSYLYLLFFFLFLLYIQQILHSLCLSVYIVFLFNSSFRPAPVPSFTAVLPLLAPCSDVSIRSRYTYSVGGLGVKTIAYPQFILPPNMEEYVVKMKRDERKTRGRCEMIGTLLMPEKKEKMK